jgi:hypothetical protein
MAQAPRTANSRIAEIETFYDDFVTHGYRKTFSVYEYLRSTDCPYGHALCIADYYRPLAAEAEELKGGDPQLREAYSHLTKAQINKLVEQVQSIVSEAERFAGNIKASKTKKPRLRKEKTAEQLVKDFAFLAEDRDLQLISVPAAQIVGADTVYLYNTKYKTLQVLVAKERNGLSAKGWAVTGWDPEKSFAKTVRKPGEFFKQFLSVGWKSKLDMARALTSKTQEPSGRSSRETIVVKAVVQSG